MKPHAAIAIFAVIMLIAGAMMAVFVLPAVLAQTQVAEYEMSGWAWTENYGWISLNCDNPGIDAGCAVEYKAVVDGAGNVTGWGWSENVGWICFGATCRETWSSGPKAGQQYVSNAQDLRIIKGNFAQNIPDHFEGDAGVVSLGAEGIIRLGYSGKILSPDNKGEQCYDCKPKCDEPVFNAEGVQVGCSAYSDSQFDSCATCFTSTCFGDDTDTSGSDNASNCPPNRQRPNNIVGDDPVSGGSGLVCSGFESCTTEETADGAKRVHCTDSTKAQCQQFGLRVRNDNGGLLGWGWNGNGDGATGAGWVKFHGGGAGIVYPWLETRYGSIYVPSSGKVTQRTGVIGVNATYCIFADSIANIASANCTEQVIHDVNLSFPAGTVNSLIYRNALGKIDVTGLITDDNPDPAVDGYNKYNQLVKNITSASGIGDVLNNKVYVSEHDLHITDRSFANGAAGERGNGTIVVKGDLYIDGNISYTNAPGVTNTNQLASVAWIVLGDVIIAPSVDEVAGAFVALGRAGSTCSPKGDPDFPQYDQNGCGAFFSGEGSGSLDVLGIVVAKAFDLRRSFSDASRGSERIIYDGRLIANPPPGFKSFTEGLPVIRDFSF